MSEDCGPGIVRSSALQEPFCGNLRVSLWAITSDDLFSYWTISSSYSHTVCMHTSARSSLTTMGLPPRLRRPPQCSLRYRTTSTDAWRGDEFQKVLFAQALSWLALNADAHPKVQCVYFARSRLWKLCLWLALQWLSSVIYRVHCMMSWSSTLTMYKALDWALLCTLLYFYPLAIATCIYKFWLLKSDAWYYRYCIGLRTAYVRTTTANNLESTLRWYLYKKTRLKQDITAYLYNLVVDQPKKLNLCQK